MQYKTAFLWLFIALCLNFHTQYELTGIYFGIQLSDLGANGKVPISYHIMTILVNIIPLLFAL